MDDNLKLGAAIAGGYLLGRTKQGKRAMRLAMWLKGGGGGPVATLGKQGIAQLGQNPAVAQLFEQLRGPLADAVRRAVTAAIESRASALADTLHERTAALASGEARRPDADADDDLDEEVDDSEIDDQEQHDEEEESEDEEADEQEQAPPRSARGRTTRSAKGDDKAGADEAKPRRGTGRGSRTKRESTTSARRSGTASGRTSRSTAGTSRSRGAESGESAASSKRASKKDTQPAKSTQRKTARSGGSTGQSRQRSSSPKSGASSRGSKKTATRRGSGR